MTRISNGRSRRIKLLHKLLLQVIIILIVRMVKIVLIEFIVIAFNIKLLIFWPRCPILPHRRLMTASIVFSGKLVNYPSGAA
jgi:hypothetical protein